MSFGLWLEAEYESGYVHREDDDDHSPYVPGRNRFFDMLHGLPTKAGHGRMVRFSAIGNGVRYDIDWTVLPEGARVIYYRQMSRTVTPGADPEADPWQDHGPRCHAHFFGFQYTDPVTGEHVQKVEEIIP